MLLQERCRSAGPTPVYRLAQVPTLHSQRDTLFSSRSRRDRPRRADRHTRRRQRCLVACRHIVIVHGPPTTAGTCRSHARERAGLVANQACLALYQGSCNPALPAVLEPEDRVGAGAGLHEGVGGGEGGDAEFWRHAVVGEELNGPGFLGGVRGFGIAAKGVEVARCGGGGGRGGGYVAGC